MVDAEGSPTLEDLDDVKLVEPVFGGGKNQKSSRTIILTHWENCMKEGSKEMMIGGVQKRMIDGEIVEWVAPNQIEIFINHVEMLKRSLTHEVFQSVEITKKLSWFEKVRENYIAQYRKRKRELVSWYKSLGMIITPSGYTQRDLYADKYKKMRQHIQEVFNEKMLELYQEQLFPFLTMLMSEREYFSQE